MLRPGLVSSLLKWWCSAQRNNVVDLLYYEQSLCLRCSHTERGSRVQEQLWTIRSKTSQNWRAVSHSSCTSHRRPVTFVLLIVLHFFKGLAGTIGHLEAFMWRKTNVVFLFLLFSSGEELHRGEGFHLLAWLPATVKNNSWNCSPNQISRLHFARKISLIERQKSLCTYQ